MDVQNKAYYKSLKNEAKQLAEKGLLSESVKKLKEAQNLYYSEKLANKIQEMEEFMAEHGETLDANTMVEITKGFSVHCDIYSRLYPYQRDGIAWLFGLYQKRKGGVIGDDMGLGKTIQIIAFLSGMFDADKIKAVLIVMPVSLIPNWEKEFEAWAPGIDVCLFHGSNQNDRERNLLKVQKRGGVLLTTYGLVVTSHEALSSYRGQSFVWDYVILDEGHKIKNPTKTTKAIHGIPAKNRIVLTGTPIQNNLNELWSLYDYVHQGGLLGSKTTFKMQYATPITRAREKGCTAGERRLGTRIAESLRELIAPYFLRRTKQEVLSEMKEEKENEDPNFAAATQRLIEKFSFLSKKDDFIVWTCLSEKQISIYADFLNLEHVKNLLMTSRSPLVELVVLKKICDHPRLLSRRACMQLGLSEQLSSGDLEDLIDDESAEVMDIDNVSDELLLDESGKLQFLMELLENLRTKKHRTLIFSQSRRMLDIIHRILSNRGWCVLRLDGTITKLSERQKRIDRFQEDESISVFLLTTQVGGVGLTLTGADRVVIYDPSWNPATDAQAVDRVYRIGQEKKVIVYRLITCGTVEEKIYRRQVFKDSIIKQATGQSKDPFRYFSRQELRELFVLDDPQRSRTQEQLQSMHGTKPRSDQKVLAHIAYLHTLNIYGLSDHDLVFSKDTEDDEADQDDGVAGEDYIKKMVENAKLLVQSEATLAIKQNEQLGEFARPFSLPVPTRKSPVPPTRNVKTQEFPDVIDLEAQAFSRPLPTNSHDYRGNDETSNVVEVSSDEDDGVHSEGASTDLFSPENNLSVGSLDKSLAVMNIDDSLEVMKLSGEKTEVTVQDTDTSRIEDNVVNSDVSIASNSDDVKGQVVEDSFGASRSTPGSPYPSTKTIETAPMVLKALSPSIKRITPLHVPKNTDKHDTPLSPFQKAMANSLELSMMSSDSPVQPVQRKFRRQILQSDDEECDAGVEKGLEENSDTELKATGSQNVSSHLDETDVETDATEDLEDCETNSTEEIEGCETDDSCELTDEEEERSGFYEVTRSSDGSSE